MANEITKKDYEEIKNKRVSVISFKDGRRTFTYAGLSYKEAIDEMLRYSENGVVCLVITEEQDKMMDTTKRELSYFIKKLKEIEESPAFPKGEPFYCCQCDKDTDGLSTCHDCGHMKGRWKSDTHHCVLAPKGPAEAHEIEEDEMHWKCGCVVESPQGTAELYKDRNCLDCIDKGAI